MCAVSPKVYLRSKFTPSRSSTGLAAEAVALSVDEDVVDHDATGGEGGAALESTSEADGSGAVAW